MKCPFCNSEDSILVSKKVSGTQGGKRRECAGCGKRFTVYETDRKGQIKQIRKRDGRIVDFDQRKVTEAIWKAAQSVGGKDKTIAKRLSDQVVEEIGKKFHEKSIPAVEEIQDIVEKVLIENGHAKTAKAYILYRAKRAAIRKAATKDATLEEERIALLDMFSFNSKLKSMIKYDVIEAYKELLFGLKDMQKTGELPTHPDYLGGSELATSIFQNKYYLKDIKSRRIEKRPEDVFARLAAFMAAVEQAGQQRPWAEKFYRLLYDGMFVPGGRVIAGAGDMYRLKTLANCFVTLIGQDNLESIYAAAYDCARTYSYGGGIGVDISCLRPRGSVVHNAADNSTGSVSFMEIYSLTTGLIGQSGRRGALMITMDIKHPDSPHFINVKKIPNWVTNQIVEQCKWSGAFSEQQLAEIQRQVRENTQVRFANISLKASDEFMQAVKEQKEHGPDKVLVYKKDRNVSNIGSPQGGAVHYSFEIPSKPIEKYQFMKSFDSVEGLNRFLESASAETVDEDNFNDPELRDMFGDMVISLPGKEHDLAIKRAGDFMLYYNSPTTGEIKNLVKARDIWDSFVEGNYRTAEPGIIFWSTMTKYSPSNYVGRPIASTNPCGEVPLEDGGACNLGSLNLSMFVDGGYAKEAKVDWDKLREATAVAVRFLDNVVTWNEFLNPLEKQRRAAAETRRLGLGVMGIADMLNQLGIAYDSGEGLKTMEKVMKTIANAAYAASADLAAEKGASPIYSYDAYSRGAFFRECLEQETREAVRKKGIRNIAILSIAPTGTISNIALGYRREDRNYIGVSGGIEPIFALFYTRRTESMGNMKFKIFHSTVQAYIDQAGLWEKAQKCNDIDDLRQLLPGYFFRTAHFIDPEKRVLIQGMCQKYIDHSISSTVNLPEDIDPEVISDVYLKAWKSGLKGITIYRDGSRYPILSVEGKKTAFQEVKDKAFMVEMENLKGEFRGDQVMAIRNRLTTVYHAINAGILVESGGAWKLTAPKQRAADPQAIGLGDGIEEAIRGAAIGMQTAIPAVAVSAGEAGGITASAGTLSKCPSCQRATLKIENGCKSCIDAECGFALCDT